MKTLNPLILLALAIGFSHVPPAWAGPATAPRLITVSGDADVLVVPDEAVLRIGVEIENESLAKAKKENDNRVRKVLDSIKRLGVEPRYIQTERINVSIHYRDYRKIRSYMVSKNIEVTLKKLPKLEKLITDTIQAGANRIFGVDFRSTELRKHKDKARLMALRAAREKADAMASALGQKAGRPHSIQENASNWSGGGWGMRNVMAQNAIQGPGPGAGSTGVTTAAGMIRINAKVTVAFELK